MDSIKLEHFQRSHPGLSFPPVHELGDRETEALRARLVRACGLPTSASAIELTNWIAENATQISRADASSASFNVQRLLTDLGIRSEPYVFLNWYRFDKIDKLALVDLTRYFSDIWYPASDDIEIFDSTCDWMLAIAHTGSVRLTVLTVP